jgi:hypothetical protein
MGALAAIVIAGLLLWVVRSWINTRLGREPTDDEVCREVMKVYEPADGEIYRKVQNHPYRDQARVDLDQARTDHDRARMELMARLGMDLPTNLQR